MENTSVELSEWFCDNQIKANPDKCHLIKSESKSDKYKDLVISESKGLVIKDK